MLARRRGGPGGGFRRLQLSAIGSEAAIGKDAASPGTPVLVASGSFIYLATGTDGSESSTSGGLKGSGNQTYEVPAGTDTQHDTV